MNQKLRVGIVGCGEAAQILHIPALTDLSDLYQITALCDASPTVLAGVGAKLPQARVHTDAAGLCADRQVDVVLVANPNLYHAETALLAMAAGKHVVIEKPMCISLAEADTLAEAELKHGVTVQVGYMRRHAPAFEAARDLVAEMQGRITLARVHDVIGPNSAFIDGITQVIRGNDIPQDVLDAARAEQARRFMAAVGVSDGPKAAAYGLMLGLSSHDISAMRELLGMPQKVLYARADHGGMFITAAFDYGSFVCQFETGIDKVARFDAHLEVYATDKVVRVDYDTPYIRHQPARLTVTEPNTASGISVTQSHSTRTDAFVIEWRRFHSDLHTGHKGKCTIADARQDLEIFRDMMTVME